MVHCCWAYLFCTIHRNARWKEHRQFAPANGHIHFESETKRSESFRNVILQLPKRLRTHLVPFPFLDLVMCASWCNGWRERRKDIQTKSNQQARAPRTKVRTANENERTKQRPSHECGSLLLLSIFRICITTVIGHIRASNTRAQHNPPASWAQN